MSWFSFDRRTALVSSGREGWINILVFVSINYGLFWCQTKYNNYRLHNSRQDQSVNNKVGTWVIPSPNSFRNRKNRSSPKITIELTDVKVLSLEKSVCRKLPRRPHLHRVSVEAVSPGCPLVGSSNDISLCVIVYAVFYHGPPAARLSRTARAYLFRGNDSGPFPRVSKLSTVLSTMSIGHTCSPCIPSPMCRLFYRLFNSFSRWLWPSSLVLATDSTP